MNDKELMWKKLKEPWHEGKCKVTLSDDGTRMYKDLYGDGAEVDMYLLSTPYNIETATYKSTDYCSAWGMT